MANLVGQVGCVTGLVAILIIGVAFFVGQALDNYFGTSGVFTIIFMLGSFPVTLWAMVRMSLHMVAKAQERMAQFEEDQKRKNSTQEEEQAHT
ncbi:MAG: AtpZ/AtpI family protein [Anaerolineae bacterium]|nr:AtpZ/AtpI family protein [Anaerolineae bacterium]